MKKVLLYSIIGLFLGLASIASATSTFQVIQGGTGVGTFTTSQLLYGNGTNALTSVATSSLGIGTSLTVTGGSLGSQVGGSNVTINTIQDIRTTASPSFTGLTVSGISGSTQCVHVNSSGVLSGTGADCGVGSGGITALGNFSTTTGTTISLSTTTLAFNGLTLGQTIAPSANGILFTPTLTGTLNNGGLTNSTISGVSLGSNLNSLTINNGGSGVASGGTYNGSAGVTLSYNSIGAVPTSRNINTTYPIQGGGDLSADRTITTAFGTTTTWGLGNNGFVITGATGIPFIAASSTLNLPNSALANSTISGIALGNSLGTLTINSPLTGSSYNGSTGVSIGCQTASGSQAGCLSSTDWSTFNNKQAPGFQISTSSIAISNLAYFTGTSPTTLSGVATGTISAGSSAITVTAGRSAIGGALAIDCAGASGSQNGCLSSGDWTTFNGKDSFAWPWTTGQSNFGSSAIEASTTNSVPLWLKNGIYASSTVSVPSWFNFLVADNSTTTNATTTNLDVSGQFRDNSVTNALILDGSTGIAGAFGGSNCSAHNYAYQISATGTLTCGQIALGTDVTGTLPVSNGGTGQQTFTSSQLLYGNGTNALSSVATSSETCSSPLSCTGFNVLGTGGGAITLGTVGIGNGGTNSTSFANNVLTFFNGTSIVATSSQPLYVGSLFATSSALSSYFAGNVGIGSTTPFSLFSVGTGTASSSITVAEYKYGAGSNVATSTTQNIDCNASTQIAEPIGTSALTLKLINLTPGKKCIVVVQNPGGGTAGAITWQVGNGILLWVGGTVPTQTTTANKNDIWSFLTSMGSSSIETFGAQSANF